jgi:carbamoyl-phosphate synthase large subunit
MKSTGEVMGLDLSFEPAFYKALMSSGLAIKPKGSILISLADEDKADSLGVVEELVKQG